MRSLTLLLVLTSFAAAQLPPPRLPEGARALRDLAYVEGGHERQKLDLYLPAKAEGPAPVVLWVHGGGWQAGSKDQCPPLRSGYLERGYAVASIGYRLSGHAVFPAQIEDCKAAIRWLRAHAKEYSLDPQRFGVWGSSAGGHLVALIGTSGEVKEFEVGANLDQSSRVQAVCDFFGPTDFMVFVTTPGYESHATDASPEAKLLGGAVMQNKDKAARVNSITYVSQDDPPFLLVHGDKDPTVPINQSQLLFEALKKAGVSAHFHTIHGAGHGGPGFAGKNIDEMVAGFFDARLKKQDASVEALTTESTAETPVADQRATGPAGPRRGIPWEAIVNRDDKDHDGKVSRGEFRGPPPLFQRLDRNNDGFLTRDEHEAFMPPAAPAAPPTQPRPQAAADTPKGFKLDGERWTYRDGDFAMDGILLKPEGNGPFPAVLISHGLGGNAQSFGLNKAREMVQWGLVCIAPNYTHTGTGSDRAQFGASAENLRRARTCLEIVRSLPYADGKRVAAYGHSMGGFVTIGLAASAPEVLKAAAISGSGVAPRPGYPAPAAEEAEKIRAPFLILHGTADTTVRPEQSASLQQALERHHITNERHLFEGAAHPIDQTQREEVFRRVRAWFVKQGVLNG